MKKLIVPLFILLVTSSFMKSRNIIEVDILPSYESVLINGNYVAIEDVCDELYVLFFNHKYDGRIVAKHESEIHKVLVSLYAYRNVRYEKYIAVSDQIERAYKHVWNTYSISTHGVLYDDLEKEKQEQIRTRFLKRISEADASGRELLPTNQHVD